MKALVPQLPKEIVLPDRYKVGSYDENNSTHKAWVTRESLFSHKNI